MSNASQLLKDQELWERLPVARYLRAADGRFLDVNSSFVECFHGASRQALLDLRVEALYVDPADRVRWEELARAGGDVRAFEAKMVRLDGTTFWARETSHAQRGLDGAPIFYEGLIEDVTEQRRTQEELRASELRYRRLFESAKDGILILDATTAEIVDVNPFLCDLLGLSREEILGRKIWEIGPFRDVPASRINFRKLQQAEYIRYENLPLERSDGRRIAVEFVSNVYSVNDEKVVQCNVRDITERKRIADETRLEKQLFLAQETKPASPGRGAETVLVVDGEATLRDHLRQVLAANGYSVLVARDGREALALAEAHPGPIQILVTDVILPGLNGPRIAELVGANRPEMKTLYVSGHSDESVFRLGVLGPGTAFLSKPFGFGSVLRRVRELLDAN